MRKDVKNIQASVRAQLLNRAKESDRPFAEVLQYYGMERFLKLMCVSGFTKALRGDAA